MYLVLGAGRTAIFPSRSHFNERDCPSDKLVARSLCLYANCILNHWSNKRMGVPVLRKEHTIHPVWRVWPHFVVKFRDNMEAMLH